MAFARFSPLLWVSRVHSFRGFRVFCRFRSFRVFVVFVAFVVFAVFAVFAVFRFRGFHVFAVFAFSRFRLQNPLSARYEKESHRIGGKPLVEDSRYYNRNHQMRSRLMCKCARDNEDAQSFGDRYDDGLTKRIASTSTNGTSYDSGTFPGFQPKMVVGFKPMLGVFSQFKYIPLKACHLVLELELASNFIDCLVAPGFSGDFPARLMISTTRAVSSNLMIASFNVM